MKKTAIVVILGLVIMVSATCFHAFGRPPGPPAGPSSRGEVFGGPPGPPPFPPPRGGFFGGPPGPPPGPPPHGAPFVGIWGGPPHLSKKLKLTDDQRKKMRLAYVNFQTSTRKNRKVLMGLRDEKETMLISGKIDQAKLAKLDEEITKLTSDVMGERLKMEREHLGILTPEQLDRLAEFLGKRAVVHGPKMMDR